MGIAITLLPALVISGFNLGKLITSENNKDKEESKNICIGSIILFFLNFLSFIFMLLIFYNYNNDDENDNEIDNENNINLFYFDRPIK